MAELCITNTFNGQTRKQSEELRKTIHKGFERNTFLDVGGIIKELNRDAPNPNVPVRSVPEVHFVARNLRIVVVKLRHNLGSINEEIKLLSKVSIVPDTVE